MDKRRECVLNMDKIMDLRTRTTIRLLTDALFELMQQKSFEEISVKEICNVAQVNRSTFYNRFEDKQQLLMQLLKELKIKFTQHFPGNKNNKPSNEYFIYMFEQVLKDIKEHRAFYEKNLISGGDYIRHVFNESISKYICDELKSINNTKERTDFKLPIVVIAEFYTGAAISLAVWWFRTGMSVSIQEMTKYFDTLISH
ncbi:MAG: TetR/AcrR family transcriptional regulator [Clostridia bacterium]|jgi:AcrR family transcriptional regulator|nr:TetR/AcrR family transcriptional regulator [Clostridia bacterium]